MAAPRVPQVLTDVLRHPFEYLICRWHWKSAVVSSVCRAAIFFSTTVPSGLHAGTRAMLTEFAFRVVVSGLLGSLTQSLRSAEPAWAAATAALVIMPALGHTGEFLVHRWAGTPRLSTSISASVAFTAVTTVVSLFAMRRGALLVGPGQQSLLRDLSMMPRLFVDLARCGTRSIGTVLRVPTARSTPRALR
jgi:hypothetical protein